MRTAEDHNDMRLLQIVTSTIIQIYACRLLLSEGGSTDPTGFLPR